MKLNMFEVIFAICFTVQNVSEPLLILTERSIMAHIAIILSENNLSDIIIEEIVCRNTCVECNYITYESPFTSFCGIMNP